MKNKTNLFRYVLVTLLFYGTLISSGQIPDSKTDPNKNNKINSTESTGSTRVFFASHSLMWYVPKPLGVLSQAAGFKGYQLAGVQSIGASKTLAHWNLTENKNQAKKALQSGKIDVFIMSPISFPDEGIENFIKLGLKHNPKMRFVVQLSWGGGDIDNQDFPKGAFTMVDKEKTADQLKQLNQRNIKACETQIEELNKKYGNGKKIIAIVPSSQAMMAIRTKIANKEMPGLSKQRELFVDAVHPSAPMEALNTYLHFAVLYHKSPVNLPMPEKLKSANRPDWDEKFNRLLQEIAWKTVTNYPPSLVSEK